MTQVTIFETDHLSHLADVKSLFVEYQNDLNLDLSFQAFENELTTLPGEYARPSGNIYLAGMEGEIAGCIALRPIDLTEQGLAKCCEMKRLFVRREHRGNQIGSLLVDELLQYACAAGYRYMVLDSLERLKPALTLYREKGFEPYTNYCHNPESDAIYLIKTLA